MTKGMGECSAFAKHSAEIFILARLFSQGPPYPFRPPLDSHRHTHQKAVGCWAAGAAGAAAGAKGTAAMSFSNGRGELEWLEFVEGGVFRGFGGQKLLMRHPILNPILIHNPSPSQAISPAVLVMADQQRQRRLSRLDASHRMEMLAGSWIWGPLSQVRKSEN